MRAVTNTIRRDQTRDNFWTKVDFFSDKDKQTSFLLCASYEYLTEKLHSEEINEIMLNNWIESEVRDIKVLGESIFNKPRHMTVRAVTDDGYQNGVSFLTQIATQ